MFNPALELAHVIHLAVPEFSEEEVLPLLKDPYIQEQWFEFLRCVGQALYDQDPTLR